MNIKLKFLDPRNGYSDVIGGNAVIVLIYNGDFSKNILLRYERGALIVITKDKNERWIEHTRQGKNHFWKVREE